MTCREAVQELSPWPEPSRWHGLHSFLGSRGSSAHSSSLAEGTLRTRGGLRKLGFILPSPLPGPYKHGFPDHTPQNSQRISHPSAAAPRNSSPPQPLPFLGLVFPLLSVPSQASLPSSPVLVALPTSCRPPALHLCLSEPQVINSLPPGLAFSHLYPVGTNWKDRLSPRPCFHQEPTMHYRQGSFEI